MLRKRRRKTGRVLTLLVVALCIITVPVYSRTESGDNKARPITRATLYGVGPINLYETYLSPLEYSGTQLHVLRESSRTTTLFDGNVSRQTLFQGYIALADNPTETANYMAGMLNWNYALHYRLPIPVERFRLGIGPMIQAYGGFIYNTRNGNNPAQAKLYASLAASVSVFYRFNRLPLSLRYQGDIPLVGAAFSPQYQQSYYEIFSLGHTDGIIRFTSLHNAPSMRHLLTADYKIRKVTIRVGYMADIQQSRIGGLRTHDYNHSFMLGLVKKLLLVNGHSVTNFR